MRWQASRLVLALVLSGALSGCARRDSGPPEVVVVELRVRFLVSEGFDPTLDVASWRISLHDANGSVLTTSEVADGEPLRLDGVEPREDVYVRIESFDSASEMLAYGRTERLDLTPEPAQATLYFAPPSSLLEVTEAVSERSAPAVLGLSDGRVLIAGGLQGDRDGADETYLFDPRTNAVSEIDPMPAPQRLPAAFSPAPDVLVLAGGWNDQGEAIGRTQVFRWDASSGSGAWSDGPALGEPRADAAAVALGDGRTLLVTGTNGAGFLASTELFTWDGSAGLWSSGPEGRARAAAVALPLGAGRALVVGGRDAGGALNNIQLYLSDNAGDTLSSAPGANLGSRRAWPAVLPLSSTSWLIAGGIAGNGNARDSSEIVTFDEATGITEAVDGPSLPSARWRGGGGRTAGGQRVLAGGDTGAGILELVGINEALVFEAGSLSELGPSPGATVTCSIVPLADGTSLFVTDNDFLRFNP